MVDMDDSRIDDSGSYELDLEGDAGDLDAAIRDAVEAVEQGGHETEIEIENAADADAISLDAGLETPVEAAAGGGNRASSAAAEAAQLKERLARTLADFDNFRKRVEREKEAARRYAHTDVLRDLVGVLDNLERAHAASGSIDDLKVGVEMIVRQLGDTLRRHGAERLTAVGARFDPNSHEAVSRIESAEVDQPTVTAEHQAGYRYHDRLLRPAMVTVAMPMAPAASRPAPADDPASSDPGAGPGGSETV